MRRVLALTGVLLGMAGCGTLNSFASACPAPFSGVRTDLDYLRSFEAADLWHAWLVPIDLPLSLVGDAALWPVAAFLEPAEPPYPLGLGCRWAR